MTTITTERRARVSLIGLNRPAKRNAFDPEMFHSLARALGDYEADRDSWCAVIFAHGDHFTGGIDLAQFAPRFAAPGDPFQLAPGSIDPFGLRNRLSKPLIIAVQGITFTIGIEMLLAADIRIAASNARFAQMEVARGLYPLGGATFRLVREAGWGNAMRYMLTGDHWGAEESFRMGVTQQIAATPAAALEAGIAMARKIAACAPLSIKATLASAHQYVDPLEADALSKLGAQYSALYRTEDFLEGRRAEAEGRPPQYKGR